jgi:iron complex transport system permease protein
MATAGRTVSRETAVLVMLALLAFAFALAGLAFGPVRLSLGDIGSALIGQADPAPQAIFGQIRAPRVLLGAAVGAGLALSGVALQGVLRNPLADPGLIGVTAGAAVGAVAVIVLDNLVAADIPETLRLYLLPLAAFCGAALVTAFVFRVARHGGIISVATLILAGVAVNAIAGAAIGAMVYVSDDTQLRNLTFWSMGGLGAANWTTAALAALCILAAGAGLARMARALDLFQLGERAACRMTMHRSCIEISRAESVKAAETRSLFRPFRPGDRTRIGSWRLDTLSLDVRAP